MRKHKKIKIIIFIIASIAVIGAVLFLYFSQGDWYETQGWEGGYNKDSATMKGVEGLELTCSVDARIVYSYVVNSGGAELKITRDAEGNDVVKVVTITKDNSSGIITFDNTEPKVYYLHETALSKDSDFYACGEYEVYRTKWEQLKAKMDFRFGKDAK